MRSRSLVLAAGLTAGMFQISDAVVRPKGAESPLVSATKAPRTFRTTTFASQTRLAQAGFSGWRAIWDRDTDVPLRLWGPGQLVAGSVANPAIAETAARQFLAAHLHVLAPGASAGDFELVSNDLNSGVRSVGFIQRANGMRVLGGTLSVSFKHDRLVLVRSTALPNISVAAPTHRIAPTTLAARATAWLAADGHAVTAQATQSLLPSDRVIVPVVRPRRGGTADITYRVAEQLAVATTDGSPGRWNVWLDAGDASPIARRSTIHYATGTVKFNVPDRHPAGTRAAYPASRAAHVVNGTAVTSGADGTITWAGTAPASVALKLTGPLVAVSNKAGSLLTETVQLADAGSVTWSKATEEFNDAQLTAFIHASAVKDFARARFTLTSNAQAWTSGAISVVVNESQTCNAYSTGDDIHFFRKGTQCENTGRLADVVYHEFGHSLHANSVIEGVGQFDGAMSEGISDVLASHLTGDPGMGRGFFLNDEALRHLDPAGVEKRWPDDVTGEVHNDGEIIGGALWDLRTDLEASLGQSAGFEKTLHIYYAILQRASDIPSAYAEVLLADDDDGNLANGTPNQCVIDGAFGKHGLADPSATLGIGKPVRDGFALSLPATPPANACPGAPTVTSVVADWNLRGGSGGQVPLTTNGTTYEGSLPTQPEGTVVQYKVTVTLSDASTMSFPANDADPKYEFYVGPVMPIRCFDFESGLDGWTHGANPSTRDEWEVGAPMGIGGDPAAAFGGTSVLGIDLTNNGTYRALATSFAESPEIDVSGHTAVRLQYQRWLGVEDGFYDQARILINGAEVWNNYASQNEPQAAGVNHADKEWRFADFDLATQAATGKVKIRFELTSDPGLELAGWNVDDLCVVAAMGPAVTCGNSVTDEGETCDDGNRTDGDGCNANCQDETEPPTDDDTGCCSVGGGPEGAAALTLLVFGVVLRRRRRS